jgi:hypothetical protein
MVEMRYIVVEVEAPGEESIGGEGLFRSTVRAVVEDSGGIIRVLLPSWSISEMTRSWKGKKVKY